MKFLRIFCNRLILKEFFLTLIVAGLGLLWSLSIFAATASDNTNAADELMQLLGNIKTMQANFVQTTLGKSKAQSGQSVIGTMALARPGKFRWETKQPTQQLIVANGKLVWLYDVDLAQVTRQSLQNTNEEGNPAQLLSGDNTSLRNTFKVMRLAADSSLDADNKCFTLQPKNKNNIYHRINLCFSGDKLSNMVMEDNLGQRSKFVFSKVVINTNLAASLFVFVPPKGVDVIDNSNI
jgi:outer membrane lipoprotein carrier protein